MSKTEKMSDNNLSDNKKSHSTTKAKRSAKITDEYMCTFSWRKKPVSDAQIEDIGQQLAQWAYENDRALTLKQFWHLKGVHKSYAEKWVERNEVFRECHAFAKSCIAVRRELGALERKYDSATVAFMMPHWCDDWKKITEWRNELKTKVEAEKAKITIIELPALVEEPDAAANSEA